MTKAEFIRQFICCICNFPQTETQFCHVRTSANSGTAIKPDDAFTIPACRECHHLETVHGRVKALKMIQGVDYTRQEARDYYLNKAVHYETLWQKTLHCINGITYRH